MNRPSRLYGVVTAVLTIPRECSMTVDWPAIVHEYGPVVWNTAYRLLGQEADAADCFQETFLSAMDVARRQTVENWPGLLKRLATARALDQLRRRMKHTSRQGADTDCAKLASPRCGPLEEAQATELGNRLVEAIAQLPPQQSQVFCLRHMSEMSYEEIAIELNLSIDAVGVILYRARGRLRELLGCLSVNERESR